jgi:hypothetical protein
MIYKYTTNLDRGKDLIIGAIGKDFFGNHQTALED